MGFGIFDHRDADAVLHGKARRKRFNFAEQASRRIRRESRQLEERRVTDQFGRIGGDLWSSAAYERVGSHGRGRATVPSQCVGHRDSFRAPYVGNVYDRIVAIPELFINYWLTRHNVQTSFLAGR